MIIGKLWRSIKAQMNKVANFFWGVDPIAQLQYEYDKLVDQLKEGRVGLEQYRALVERVEGQEHLTEALRRGKGALVITGHIGCWELVPAYFASRRNIVESLRFVG